MIIKQQTNKKKIYITMSITSWLPSPRMRLFWLLGFLILSGHGILDIREFTGGCQQLRSELVELPLQLGAGEGDALHFFLMDFGAERVGVVVWRASSASTQFTTTRTARLGDSVVVVFGLFFSCLDCYEFVVGRGKEKPRWNLARSLRFCITVSITL